MKYILSIIITLILLQESFSQCYSSGQHLPNEGYITHTSGSAELDKIVFEEIYNLQIFFKVKVDFFYILETYSKNAMYIPECNYNCNGSVLLGYKMLLSQLRKEHGIESIKAILAHEFGHCVQNLMQWTELGKRRELHSDFMAGYYIGSKYYYTDAQMSSLFYEFYSMGDNNYWSPKHHGTGPERECAFLEGYYYAKENNTTVQTAYNYGIQYVLANNPCIARKYKAIVNIALNDVKTNNLRNLEISGKSGVLYKVVITYPTGIKNVYYINGTPKKTCFNGCFGGCLGGGSRIEYIDPNTKAMDKINLNNLSNSLSYGVKIYQYSKFWGEYTVTSDFIIPPDTHRNIRITIVSKRKTHFDYGP